MENERLYWLSFSAFPGVGPLKFNRLIKKFGTARDAWSAGPRELQEILGRALTIKFEKFKRKFPVQNYADLLKKKNVSCLILTDSLYPALLKKIKNPPFVLYLRGNASLFDLSDRTIAVVGARRTTQYGREATAILTRELAEAGFTVVSGLAIGVDAIASKTTIDSQGGTIAVLGCGVDCCTPKENQYLYNSIIDSGGAIVSELPLSHPPNKGSFPQRNRIIAGLSLGVLVTEGAEDSGSLITADYAIKFNRRVFAVPGPITSSLSRGPYKLIQKGAKLVTSAQDIISELGISNIKSPVKDEVRQRRQISNKPKITKGETSEENKILEILESEELHFDEIVRKMGLQSAKIGSMLSLMEMKGLVKSREGGFFSL